ncbi:MAG: Mu transposase C-terminal domain-containing protein, partial [Anaerotignaceae bacterium]
TGGTVLEKPDSLKGLVKTPENLVGIEDFKKQVDTYINGWYNKQVHSGEGMYNKCPDEVFAKNLVEQKIVPQDKLNLMFMRYAKGNKGTIKVGKNGVSLKFYGQELQFWNEELWKIYFGRDVYVRYSPDDLSSVRVYDSEMRFICTAHLRNQLGYNATKEDIMREQQQNRKAVKAVSAYKKSKGIEAEDALKLIIEEAERNAGNIYQINPQVIRPVYGASEEVDLLKVAGDYDEPIDWSKAVERLKRAKEE